MNTFEMRWCPLVVLVASMTVTSCSVFHDDAESQWRTLHVLHVQPRTELSNYVDAHCVDPAIVAPGDVVAVVKFGVGRARRFQAFPIPSGRSLHEGDTVVVHAGRCLLKDSASAA